MLVSQKERNELIISYTLNLSVFFFCNNSFFTNLFLHNVHTGYLNCLARALKYQQKHWKPMQKLLLWIYWRVKHNRMMRGLNNQQVAAWHHTSRCSALDRCTVRYLWISPTLTFFCEKVDLKIVFGDRRNIFLLKRVRILLVLQVIFFYSIFWHVGESKLFYQKSNARSYYGQKVFVALKNTLWGCLALCTLIRPLITNQLTSACFSVCMTHDHLKPKLFLI